MSYPFQITSYDQYKEAYKQSVDQPEQFWSEIASQFKWRKKWDQVLEWNFRTADIKWFINGKLNITENCLDRHLETSGNTPALIWEPNSKEDAHQVITYKELHFKVNQFAQVLRNNGVKKGDRVCRNKKSGGTGKSCGGSGRNGCGRSAVHIVYLRLYGQAKRRGA